MKTRIKIVLKQFGFLFCVYFALRLLFLVYNWSRFEKLTFVNISEAFLLGARIDISTLLWVQMFFIFYEMIRHPQAHWPPKWRLVDRFIYFLLFAVHSFFILVNLVDVELTNFMGQRLNLNIFNMREDVERQAGQMLFHYWYLLLLLLFVIYVLVRFYPRAKFSTIYMPFQSKFQHLGAVFLLLILLPLGVRGGLQRKPLKPTHALSFSSSDLAQLALNTTFTMIHSSKNHHESRISWLSVDQVRELEAKNNSILNYDGPRPKNIVLFIMESFALEYCGFANEGKGYTPFLDELTKSSLSFQHAFANGRRSIQAVPSILAGIPSWLHDPFLMSSYQGIHVQGVADALAKKGMHTAFFHGAENGSMYFDTFASRTGFQKYYGRNEYPENKKDFDGFWGILDEPFFQFVAERASNENAPFFYSIFSLSSHQPYPVPEKYKGKIPKGTLPIHESIGYADYSLRQFFEKAKTESWFKDTVFIITADHTSLSDNVSYQNTIGAYRVPLIIYYPGVNLKADQDRFVQHADIAHTILDLIGDKNTDLGSFGRSIFSSESGFVLNGNSNDGFWYKDKEHAFRLNHSGEVSPLVDDPWPATSDSEKDSKVLNAKYVVQKFINGMIDNKLYKDR